MIRGADAGTGAGDINGDGLGDLLIGSVVVFGKATTEAVELPDVAAGQGGFGIWGVVQHFSVSRAGAGDVDGDGLGDLVIGVPWGGVDGDNLAGSSYVVLGKATTEAVQLSDVAASRGGFVIRGENVGDYSGASVSGAGDTNGDGLGDLLIGAPEAGSSYVVFGKATTEAVELSDVATGRRGFVIRQESQEPGGGSHRSNPSSVSGAGDVNGDGLGDVLIGAYGADAGGKQGAGSSYVVFGKSVTEAVELCDIAAGRGGFVIRGEKESDYSGWSVSGAGDINGDGLQDLLIGAPGHTSTLFRKVRAGTAYVVFGPASSFRRFRRGEVNGDDTVDLSDAVATFGYLFLSEDAPGCLDGADANDDGAIDISDGIATVVYLFRGDSILPMPGPRHCGIDPTADPLGCESPPEDCR